MMKILLLKKDFNYFCLIYYMLSVLHIIWHARKSRDMRITIVNSVIIDWVMNKEFIIGDLPYKLPIGYS